MFKKKLLPLLGIAAMGTTLLAGCGARKSGFIIWATAAEQAVVEAVISEYNKTAETPIDYQFVAVSEADAGTQLKADPTVKNTPALVLCADDQLYGLIDNDILTEVTGTYKSNVQSMNTPVSVLGASYDNKVYGFPVTNDNGYFLWYDARYLSETDVLSLEKILEVCRTNSKKMLMDVPNGWYANSFIMAPEACGTESLSWKVDQEGKTYYETNWDGEEGVKVSEYIASLLTPAYNGGTNGTLVNGSNENIIAGFQDGSLIAAVSGTWMETDLAKEDCLGANMRATKLPSYHIGSESYQMASFTGSKVYVVNSFVKPEYQETALKVADLLVNSKEAQLKRFEIRQSIPCNKEALLDARYTEHKTVGGAALEAQCAVAACVQSTTAEARYWDVGKAIGQAYIDSDLGDYETWEEFLYVNMEALRTHSK